MKQNAANNISAIIDNIEETFIALMLGLMTMITFANVIARYVFNVNILWALEATVFLFAWMVLIGVSYGVKKNFHLGVDVVVNALPSPLKKIFSLIAVSACLLFCIMILKGSFDYWLPFIGPTAFLETNDVPMPAFLQFLADWLNDGERYEKIPKFIPYFALPFGMSLLTFRFIQAAWRILIGQQDMVIASHEAEDLLEETLKNQSANSAKKEA